MYLFAFNSIYCGIHVVYMQLQCYVMSLNCSVCLVCVNLSFVIVLCNCSVQPNFASIVQLANHLHRKLWHTVDMYTKFCSFFM